MNASVLIIIFLLSTHQYSQAMAHLPQRKLSVLCKGNKIKSSSSPPKCYANAMNYKTKLVNFFIINFLLFNYFTVVVVISMNQIHLFVFCLCLSVCVTSQNCVCVSVASVLRSNVPLNFIFQIITHFFILTPNSSCVCVCVCVCVVLLCLNSAM